MKQTYEAVVFFILLTKGFFCDHFSFTLRRMVDVDITTWNAEINMRNNLKSRSTQVLPNVTN